MVDGVEVAGRCDSEGRNGGDEETGFSCRLEGLSAMAETGATKKPGSAVGWRGCQRWQKRGRRRNRVQLRIGSSSTKVGTEAAKKPGSASDWLSGSDRVLESENHREEIATSQRKQALAVDVERFWQPS